MALALESLAQGRRGLTPAFGQSLAEAASVCLHHEGHSSPTRMPVSGMRQFQGQLKWRPPSAQCLRCWNDDQVATEHGAYGVAALLVEQCGLEVIERSKKKTGFDYWLGAADATSQLFQGLARLEVSGIRHDEGSAFRSRITQKLNQTKASDGVLPAVVVVVEFSSPKAEVVERCTA